MIVMTGRTVQEILFLKAGIVVRFFLEIYALSTYYDVMSYVVRESEIRHTYIMSLEQRDFRKLNILH